MARKAIEEHKTAKCDSCNNPIVPGDFVAICIADGEERLVHAGFHFTLEKQDAFCETAAVGVGVWDGSCVRGAGTSVIAKALETGKVQRVDY